MSLFSSILCKTVTDLKAQDLYGITNIAYNIFYNSKLKTLELPNTCKRIGSTAFLGNTNLTTISLPDSIELIDQEAFSDCTSLTNVNLNVNPKCIIKENVFSNCPFYTNATTNLYAANGKILLKATSTTWPSNIINIATNACNALVTNSTLKIPDYVEILAGSPASSITSLTIGQKMSYLGPESIPTTVTTLICRQPAGMEVTLPTETGEYKGLSYNKDARNMTLYTDNESMKNYNWSGDNVTVTIYPLSQAPV